MCRSLLVFVLAAFLGAAPVFAEDARAADRQQLLAMLDDIEHGINDGKIELMTRHIADKAVVTWLNAEVSHGPAEVKAYFDRMVGSGPNAVLSKYVTHPKIDQQAVFYGDVAVANGTTEDEFTPHRRSVFKFTSRWTATLKKTDGQWKIIALNLSTNTFKNALISELESMVTLAGGGGFVAALLLAGVWAFFRRRKTA